MMVCDFQDWNIKGTGASSSLFLLDLLPLEEAVFHVVRTAKPYYGGVHMVSLFSLSHLTLAAASERP